MTYPTSWKPTTKTSKRTKDRSGTDRECIISILRTFLRQEVDTTNRFLHLQALLHLAGLDVPEADRLVVAATDEPLAAQQERRTEVGVSIQESDRLREGITEVGFAMVKRAI